jgi:hypothetical protein
MHRHAIAQHAVFRHDGMRHDLAIEPELRAGFDDGGGMDHP